MSKRSYRIAAKLRVFHGATFEATPEQLSQFKTDYETMLRQSMPLGFHIQHLQIVVKECND